MSKWTVAGLALSCSLAVVFAAHHHWLAAVLQALSVLLTVWPRRKR